MLVLLFAFFGNSDLDWTLTISDLEPVPSEIVAPMVDAYEHVYFLSAKDGNVFHLNADGRLVRVFGSLGQGPGEFSYPNKIGISAQSGRIFIADPRKRTLWVVEANGSVVASPIPLGLDPPYFLGDDAILVRDTETTYGQKDQGCRVVVRFGDGSGEKLLATYGPADHPDSLAIKNGEARAYLRPAWMIQVLVAVSPDQSLLAMGSSRNLDLDLFETSGFTKTGRIHDSSFPLLPLSKEDIERDPTKVRLNGKTYTLKDLDLPQHKALIKTLLFDTKKRLWVGFSPRLDQTATQFRIYQPDGKKVGVVTVENGELFHATASHLWLAHMDDQGENHLIKKSYALEPGPE